ncbi:MAG: Holliday junction resolvase RuvX [bacterium]
MRILCLDIGSRRIGVAASDQLGITAQGIGVIERRGDAKDFEAIIQRAQELEASLLLLGIPLDEEGWMGPQAEKVQAFADRLKQAMARGGLDIPVEMWDERYSTAVAEQRLIDADVSRQKRRKVIDKMAAVAILQDYLDSKALPSDDGEGYLG